MVAAVVNSYNNIRAKKEPENKGLLDDFLVNSIVTKPVTGTPLASVQLGIELNGLLLHHVLSAEECKSIIDTCETIGFSFWADTGEQPDAQPLESQVNFRSADTIEEHLPRLADSLWQRIRPLFESKRVVIEEGTDAFEKDAAGEWKPVGISSDMLFARYLTGGHFAPHVDGSTAVGLNLRSFFTVLIYLNDCEVGGQTRFLPGCQHDVLSVDKATGKVCASPDSQEVCSVPPRTGTATAFFHDILHEGFSVGKGHKKYIIRCDIMYQREPPLFGNDPRAEEAFDMYQRARVLEADGDIQQALKLFQSIRRISRSVAELYGVA
mmetsp:Transcript_34007/g.75385  ORF Transcript_34007/g.75385 Transcript_34007/m.75385 type:complete len:323 (+) Transcript_34007:194-1162(+)|eukprot:CAMPEP_0202920792 /NCGR_PEP_ID=MMETSP1392-20130828/77044_1 /ASSEMBLY_ACC=CAM_ASM_000868 /TAXON_ID=225041 /ORGANISM="Chlamydomonas chlamydogama, Strain SAG 11-48b" /LENGTH=322 /DNA_ID=CAMNT_0049614305 /DNA_START=172 /DNA_END=1140 /DNA_ORIENTATION=-